MARKLPWLLLALAAAAVPGCASDGGGEVADAFGEAFADVAEFLGRSDPVRHAGRLDRLHDTATFRHAPDVPPTYDACVAEIRVLAASDYASWREAGVAVYVLSRAVADDSAAWHRAEAVRALSVVGGYAAEVEDPPAIPGREGDAWKAVERLREIHADGGDHASEETAAECAALLRRVGDLRVPTGRPVSPSEGRLQVRTVRGILLAALVATRAPEAHAGPDLRAAMDRAVVNLASLATRLALSQAVVFDPDARVREAAAVALGTVAPEGAALPLQAAYLRERDVLARRAMVRAAAALAALGPGPRRDGAVPLLVASLDDEDGSIAFVGRDGLRALAGEDLGDRPEPWIRWWGRAKDAGGAPPR